MKVYLNLKMYQMIQLWYSFLVKGRLFPVNPITSALELQGLHVNKE